MIYDLPYCVEIQGKEYPIRYDFRVILDIFEALNTVDADQSERVYAALLIFYPDFDDLPDYEAAVTEMLRFINGGKEESKKKNEPILISWEQDFPYICAPVNRILGCDIRSIPYDRKANTGGLHWYTFLSAYIEIGDCLFAQIVSIRNKKAKNKPLDKAEKEFYAQNREIIDIKKAYSEAEIEAIMKWV